MDWTTYVQNVEALVQYLPFQAQDLIDDPRKMTGSFV